MAIFEIPITWGLVRLWAASQDVDVSRTLVPHELAQGNTHPLHDAGLGPRPINLSLMFDDFPGETTTPEQRLERLLAQHRGGQAHMFTHPIEGSFLAKIGRFSYSIDEFGVITADAEFLPDDDIASVSPTGAGVPGIAGEATVAAAADALDFELETVYDQSILDLEDSPLVVTEMAREAVTAWNEAETVPTREIITDTADISDRLSSMIEDLALEDDLALFDVWKATMMLGEAVRSAAIAATSEVPAVFVVKVTTPVLLLRLCAQIYGGAEAEDRERQVRELNDIRSPAFFGPGELLMPVKARTAA